MEAKHRGAAAFSRGDYAVAVAEYTAAIESDPASPALWGNRSAAHAGSGDYEAALADASAAIARDPAWAKARSPQPPRLRGARIN
eukprot:m51a1_g13365 putative carboxylate clamp-tetratricopeptide repeat protein (85) ;mRNA; r:371-625